ncbi:fatty acid desaturase family protein [Millisia brevis]|uniref:fatty acid desaturase family protein n=1 Tax=Millisia brevis TaxID=264148 RepID=UPI000A05D6D3|nr:fatty acid desaturase [Millisia brevis]
MAITDIKAYAHLSEDDVRQLGAALDAIRADVEASRGLRDHRYIHNTIRLQRVLEVAGRCALQFAHKRPTRVAGTTLLTFAKIIENMELGHNISHGQWDWMNDPEIHSTSWEWDMSGTSAQWRTAHNYSHHVYTNIVGMDEDVGFGILRMTRDEPWRPINLAQPVANVILALGFEWGIALHDLGAQKERDGVPRNDVLSEPNLQFWRKAGRQLSKDFLLFPLLAGRNFRATFTANLTANVLRNLWTYAVIFCGHFPDGAEKFTVEQYATETRAEWYLRQMLGSANFRAGPVMAFLSGNLCYQIEHHLFPDLPSNRLAEISVRVRALCEQYDLPYTTGSLAKQYVLAFRTIHKLALPDEWLWRTSDDAPETASELRFAGERTDGVGGGRRRGLASALRELRTSRRGGRRRRRGPDVGVDAPGAGIATAPSSVDPAAARATH